MNTQLLELAHRAEEAGVKLEWVSGLPLWEAFPSWRHQEAVERIRASLPQRNSMPAETGCACIHMPDIYIIFRDGSLKRPDASIFCSEPPQHEKDGATTLIPEAVIEVVVACATRWIVAHGLPDHNCT